MAALMYLCFFSCFTTCLWQMSNCLMKWHGEEVRTFKHLLQFLTNWYLEIVWIEYLNISLKSLRDILWSSHVMIMKIFGALSQQSLFNILCPCCLSNLIIILWQIENMLHKRQIYILNTETWRWKMTFKIYLTQCHISYNSII